MSFLLYLSPQCRVCLAKLLFHSIILKSSMNCHKTVAFPLPIIIKTAFRIYMPESMPFLLYVRISVLQPTFTWDANDFPSFSFSLHFKNVSFWNYSILYILDFLESCREPTFLDKLCIYKTRDISFLSVSLKMLRQFYMLFFSITYNVKCFCILVRISFSTMKSQFTLT